MNVARIIVYQHTSIASMQSGYVNGKRMDVPDHELAEFFSDFKGSGDTKVIIARQCVHLFELTELTVHGLSSRQAQVVTARCLGNSSISFVIFCWRFPKALNNRARCHGRLQPRTSAYICISKHKCVRSVQCSARAGGTSRSLS